LIFGPSKLIRFIVRIDFDNEPLIDAIGREAIARTAIIEHFRDTASILIATEAAAEGVNMQFCSLVVNYDLPWNPQRIEQRIGRCHRYGQEHDVVVINFINSRNEADQRVHQLLQDKFKLFDGVFGTSDEVLGSIESGLDFEKRILAIYQECRTPAAIEAAFNKLRAELDESIQNRMAETQKTLLENFDEDVHQRLKLELADTQSHLDAVSRRFWSLSRHVIGQRADWTEADHSFHLSKPPADGIDPGHYFLISKNKRQKERTPEDDHGRFLYRLGHPLGEWTTDTAKGFDTPVEEIRFDITNHPTKLALVEKLKGHGGLLTLIHLRIESYEEAEYLLFSAIDDAGNSLDQETCEKLFQCTGSKGSAATIDANTLNRLEQEAKRHIKATISRSLEANSKHFNQARERLERWAEDTIHAAEQAIKQTREQINALQRQSRQAQTLDEQKDVQEQILKLERKRKRQRMEYFDKEDEILEKRDHLVAQLEARLSQNTDQKNLFTIRWKVT
jgi:hypothetical protein